jgi:hypothetical protein
MIYLRGNLLVRKPANKKRGADGVKIAVLRKGRASLEFIWAAAHAQRSVIKMRRKR